MYLIGFPLLLIPFAIYNIVAFVFRTGFTDTVFTVRLMSGADMSVSLGDLLIVVSLFFLFLEIVKATRLGTKSIVDHILSFALFVVMLGEFITVKEAATSTFLAIMVISLVDVIGGFSVTIRTAERDIGIATTDQLRQ